jgi:hypothetical protein
MTTDRGITTAQNNAAMMARPGDEVTAGDGLRAFGADLILPVAMHFQTARAIAEQVICEKKRHAQPDRKTDNQYRQIQRLMPSWPRSRARKH